MYSIEQLHKPYFIYCTTYSVRGTSYSTVYAEHTASYCIYIDVYVYVYVSYCALNYAIYCNIHMYYTMYIIYNVHYTCILNFK